MLFNSLSFLLFLPIVFIVYWSLVFFRIRLQNSWLLLSSYFFYGCWDWRFLFLLIFSTSLDYFSGILIAQSNQPRRRRLWLWSSISINVGFLAVFKYFNFFIASFSEGLTSLGLTTHPYVLEILLPVGISFYTFHGLSYVIDIYKNKIPAEKNFIDYSLFVSFFPLLVAGPIERATHLLPQLKTTRPFDEQQATDGVKQILWGLFKKIVIADQCAIYANMIFNDYTHYSGSTLVLGAVLFSFQIYGDFSGYSDIALGSARLFGIELLKNFNFPYFSRSIAEFWRRWHISLSTWFRDYLYIPLGGSKGNTWMTIRNTALIFLVSGFWHGANWTFIAWGGLNALFILPSVVYQTNRTHLDNVAAHSWYPSFKEFWSMLLTFCLISFAWIFFRSPSIGDAIHYVARIFTLPLFSKPVIIPLLEILLVLFFLLLEWIGRNNNYALASIGSKWPRLLRWTFFYLLGLSLIYFSGQEQPFIYFQF